MKLRICFSFDDGIRDDRRLVQLLNQYGCRATFFLNTAFDDQTPPFEDEGASVYHLSPAEMKTLYHGHEIGAHTHSHPDLTSLSDKDVRWQLTHNLELLTQWFGRKPVGFAYTYGRYDDRVVELVRETGFRYARTIDTRGEIISKSDDLLRLHPTVWLSDPRRDELLADFLSTSHEGVFHIWGHSYELTGHHSWDAFEKLLRTIQASGVPCVPLAEAYL